MISKTCYNDQRGPVYQEDGYTIESRPGFPYREERNEQLEKANSASNVLTKSMGAGYPEVIQGISQMEGPSKNSEDTSTYDKNNVETDLRIMDPRKRFQIAGKIFQLIYPQILLLISLRLSVLPETRPL